MRIACCIEYAGAGYHGWQRQGHASSVQAEVERALATVADREIAVTAAGRTDTGVHASAQIAHFDTDASRPDHGWLRGANTHLPEDIRLAWVKPVSDDFHARFGALERSYRYVICNRSVAPAILARRVTWHRTSLDPEPMAEAARQLEGTHDFSAFRASGCQNKDPVKTVHQLELQHAPGWIWLDIRASGFLHHMVRNIVGTLLRIGEGLESPQWMGQVLAGRDRTLAGITADPDGLYFTGARYAPAFELPDLPPAPRFW